MKTCVIINPNAGSVEDIDHLRTALARLPGCQLEESAESGHVTELAREAAARGVERVVAVGGDGTVSEAVNGLAPHFDRVQFGVIPLGTGNDFARSIDVPHEMEQAIDVLAAGRAHPVDVVRIQAEETHYFLNTSALGFAPLIHEQIDQTTKSWWGGWAYYWAGLKTLSKAPEYQVRLHLDEMEQLEIQAYNVMVCNGRYVGGGVAVAPQACVDDGVVEVVIIPTLSLPKLPELFTRLLQGQPQQMDELIVRRARRIRIESEPAMLFNVDGEQAGQTPVEYQVLPKTLTVVTGPNPAIQAVTGQEAVSS